MTDDALRHGQPKVARNDRYGFDKYTWPAGDHWPQGLELQVYDDGRVKVGGWHTSVAVRDVSNFARGETNASGHVIAQFEPAQDHIEGDQ